MTHADKRNAMDWANDIRGFALAWGAPLLVLAAGSVFDPPVRALMWSVALAWMGAACVINARRCGRTHCQYTGPFYLFMILPVLLQGFAVLDLGAYAWWLLGVTVIWSVTEATWGKYSSRRR